MLLPYHEDFGEEHLDHGHEVCPMCGQYHEEQPQRRSYTDIQVLSRIALMLESDLVGTVAILLRSQCGHTYETIGKRFKGCRTMTRQAVEQRTERLAEQFPELAGVLVDLCRREKINGHSHTRKRYPRSKERPNSTADV